MKLRLRTLALVVGVALIAPVLTGCGAEKVDPAAIEGSWRLEAFGGSTAVTPVDPAVATDMVLKAGQASGNSGVNSYSGPYAASSDGRCSFGPMAATAMAGEPAAMAQETKFFAGLEKAKRWELSQGKLVLGDTGNNTLLVFVRK